MNFGANPVLLLTEICALFGLPQSPPCHVLFLFQNLRLDGTFQLVNPQPSAPPGCDGFPDVSHLGDLDNLEEFRSGIFVGCPLIGICLMCFFIIRCLVCKKSRVQLSLFSPSSNPSEISPYHWPLPARKWVTVGSRQTSHCLRTFVKAVWLMGVSLDLSAFFLFNPQVQSERPAW